MSLTDPDGENNNIYEKKNKGKIYNTYAQNFQLSQT